MGELLHAIGPTHWTRSIRVRLLFWYSMALLIVLGGSGIALYFATRRAEFEDFEAQLESRARAVSVALATMADSSDAVAEFRLPEELARYFDRPKPGQPHSEDVGERPYYVIWNAEGAVIDASPLPSAVPFFTPKPPPHDPHKLRWRNRDIWRETVLAGPRGTFVLVGRSTEGVRRHLQYFLIRLSIIGGGALAAALAGGWFLTRKALAPIAKITATAETISSSNPSQRIALDETESEFGRLAGVLNGAFDRLEEALARQVAFTADASHELRTPLTVLIASLDLALRRERSPEQYRTVLTQGLATARRMEEVIAKLLALARADSGAAAQQRRTIDLAEAIGEVIARLEPLAQLREVTCTIEAADVRIVGAPDEIALLVETIVENAILYNRPGGTVHVRFAGEESKAVLEVRDSGVGIPADDQPYVFERFYRVDKARSRESGGCGLGLAIAKRIAEEHGGTISLSSEEGVGTRVTVELPMAAPDLDATKRATEV